MNVLMVGSTLLMNLLFQMRTKYGPKVAIDLLASLVHRVEFMTISAFDEGWLPLPPATKLLPFLSGSFLCKPTRLTKKMKKAKLSSRAFQLQLTVDNNQFACSSAPPPPPAAAAVEPPIAKSNGMLQDHHGEEAPNASLLDGSFSSFSSHSKQLTKLQDRFLMAIPTEDDDRLEYRFNLEKQCWRTYFSELLCIQVGYPFLDACSRFLESLEEYDRLYVSWLGFGRVRRAPSKAPPNTR
jgi:hypothetical protein